MNARDLEQELKSLASPQRAKVSQRYFRTGKGEYGEGDIFLGIGTPALVQAVKKYRCLPLSELEKLLQSPLHECRTAALSILAYQYAHSDEPTKKKIVDFYLKHTNRINNWDLVDISASRILGDWFFDRDKKILYDLAHSKNLWERRIAIIATFGFIKKGELKETFKIAEILLADREDLIHKAVGWMLRETGKKDLQAEEAFLEKQVKKMPRTMLRYAIEKLPAEKRNYYLKKQ
jgi:3-methyladenine DNA glycosylase AlkD